MRSHGAHGRRSTATAYRRICGAVEASLLLLVLLSCCCSLPFALADKADGDADESALIKIKSDDPVERVFCWLGVVALVLLSGRSVMMVDPCLLSSSPIL